MIDLADVYVGIYAFRYGSIAEGESKSYTELEFERATARGIPCLIFLMSAEHPVLARDVETTPGAQERLAAFKASASKGRICREFKSAEDLRSQVIDALSHWKQEQQRPSNEKPAHSLHSPSHIPQAPKPYVAHPYVLLQTKNVIGRREELNELTDWITKNKNVPADTRIFSVIAIGGMGKSALTWKWFEDIAPKELPDLAGRMWWSFYESDARWENFIIRALAYTAGMPETEVRKLPSSECEDQLLRALDERPFLLVLDGLERILIAYARMDAAHLPDNDLDQQTANAIAAATGLPDDVRETYLERHRLRQCTDLRAGNFLRKLSRVRASRVLISSRLYPAELQTQTAEPLPGCHALFLRGLSDDDALALWRGFIVGERSGTSEQLLPIFRAFGNYPLLLRALAGEVAQFRPAPGEFDLWRIAHPDFNPSGLPLKNAKTHVLQFALFGLGKVQKSVLHTIVAFSMPATWETLEKLLVGKKRSCRSGSILDAALTDLEDRGLVGWEKRFNRYDVHPIVRDVVWNGLESRAQQNIHGKLFSYFDAIPKPSWSGVSSLDDLTAGIEAFGSLVGLKRIKEAYAYFCDELDEAMLYRLGTHRKRLELLEQLFPLGFERREKLIDDSTGSNALCSLALAYHFSGKPAQSCSLLSRVHREDTESPITVEYLAESCRCSGKLRSAISEGMKALGMERASFGGMPRSRDGELFTLRVLGHAFATVGRFDEAVIVLERGVTGSLLEIWKQCEGILSSLLAQTFLWMGKVKRARGYSVRAWDLAQGEGRESDFVRAARLHGFALLQDARLGLATDRLQHARQRALVIGLIEEELATSIGLAEVHRRRKQYTAARELLEEVWAPAERGPYPLWHADACNVLAQLERDLGHTSAAIEAATAAYRFAWCDGPPYAYHYGLTNAQRHLQELCAVLPDLPAFDETKFLPMPNVELNPKDEYWVDPEKVVGC